MKDSYALYGIFFFLGALSFAVLYDNLFANALETTFPPTPAFSTIDMDGERYQAQTYNDIFEMNTTGDIIIIREAPGNRANIKLAPVTCVGLNVVIGVDSNGNFICGVP